MSVSDVPYKHFEETHPEFVIIRKEGYFYSAHNESALALNKVLGYRLFVDKYGRQTTGGPNIDKIEDGLSLANYNYIVIEHGIIIRKYQPDNGLSRLAELPKGIHSGKKLKKVKAETELKWRPGTVVLDSTVSLLDLSDDSRVTVKIISAIEERRYTGSGGSYYGAKTEVSYVSDAGKTEGQATLISDRSPLGKALLGHVCGDKVSFKTDSGIELSYEIIEVC